MKQYNLPDKLSFNHNKDWIDWLNSRLVKPKLTSESFYALGFEANGIKTIGYEMNENAVNTYNSNLSGKCYKIFLNIGMPETQKCDVIIGGPPCQPFSQNGCQRGKNDHRNGFPVFLEAVRRMNPKIAITENVRGLLYRSKDYFHIIGN